MDLRDQIDEIMDNFNFRRVEIAMRAVGWTWCSTESKDGIPTESEIRKEARRLLLSVYSNNCDTIASGGLWAHKETVDGETVLSLKFVLEEYSNE